MYFLVSRVGNCSGPPLGNKKTKNKKQKQKKTCFTGMTYPFFHFWSFFFKFCQNLVKSSLCQRLRFVLFTDEREAQVERRKRKERALLVWKNFTNTWFWRMQRILLSFLDIFDLLNQNLNDASAYMLSVLRFG